ncbi:NAD(+)/NADH kinase [Halalkalirubrum salinum]|uniref:NAD(+)/NADH kinase n=1 Tax=Halalkalirubrum salinum TaxID=2563889 RepID=UPI0010FBAAEF|nr:NAD(+)/NADH kinase [Halalkalirubrum salinum]
MKIAVIGEGSLAERVGDALGRDGHSITPKASLSVVTEPQAIATWDGRFLFIDQKRRPYTVRPAAVRDAVRAIENGHYREETHRSFELSIDDKPVATFVSDLTLVTAEPAHISEYSVRPDADATRDRSRFRADGVVVATPLGSGGYAGAVGTPVLHATAGLAVAPIAPFSTHTRSWVHDTPLWIGVERDDEITVVIDGVEQATTTTGELLRVSVKDSYTLVVPIER